MDWYIMRPGNALKYFKLCSFQPKFVRLFIVPLDDFVAGER